MQPGYKDSKKTKKQKQKTKKVLNSEVRIKVRVYGPTEIRFPTHVPCHPSLTPRSDDVQSITWLFVLSVCAAAVDPLDPGSTTTCRSPIPGKDTAKPIPPHLRLGSHVDCLHRPMSFSGPYVHCASITSAARNSETRPEGTNRPYTQ